MSGVNSFIPREYCFVKYEDFDHVTNMIVQIGKGALIAKTDIESAFNILPINPTDYWLLGFKVNGLYYYKRKLPMGASISCSTFESLSKALQWIMKHCFGIKFISHILDDFIMMSARHSQDCAFALTVFIRLCENLGIPLNHENCTALNKGNHSRYRSVY